MEGYANASAHLRQQVGVCVLIEGDMGAPGKVAAHVCIVALVREDVIGAGRQGSKAGVPGCVAVTGHYRQHVAGDRAAPTGGGVVGGDEADLPRHGQQPVHVAALAAAAAVTELILNLNADDGPALRLEHALGLIIDGLPQPPHRGKVALIVAAGGNTAVHQPVRKAPVAAFAVAPWADAQPHRQPGFPAGGEEGAQVAAAGEVKLAFRLLMVDPEHIGCDDIHSAGLHFLQFSAPLAAGIAGIVEFAHHRQPGPAVPDEVLTVPCVSARHGASSFIRSQLPVER